MSIKKFFTSPKVFWTIYTLSVFAWTANVLIEFFCSKFSTWDTGAHIQPVIHWALYGEYEDKLLDVAHPFINHFRPALLILAPIVKFFPSMLVIQLAKVATFATTPLLLLHYGKKHLRNTWAYLLPILWCVHDVIITTMYAENQATSLAIPLIVWAFFLTYEKKYKRMLIPLIAIVFFKENLPLIWVSLGLFILIEQKNYKWGPAICLAGSCIGIFIFFIVIPFFAEAPSHQQESLMPFSYIGLKLLMLFRAHLSMGLFAILWPSTFIISLPIYSVYLLGTFYRALWLGSHNHDFTTAFLFCMAFYTLKQVLTKKTWFNENSKTHVNFAKTIVCILFLIGISKLPYFKWIEKIDHYKTGYQLRQLSYKIKPNLKENYTYNVSPRLMEYFIDLQTIKSFDNKRFDKIYKSTTPFYIIFPKNKRFHNMNSSIINVFYTQIYRHQQQGICSVSEITKKTATLVIAKYDFPLSDQEKKYTNEFIQNI